VREVQPGAPLSLVDGKPRMVCLLYDDDGAHVEFAAFLRQLGEARGHLQRALDSAEALHGGLEVAGSLRRALGWVSRFPLADDLSDASPGRARDAMDLLPTTLERVAA